MPDRPVGDATTAGGSDGPLAPDAVARRPPPSLEDATTSGSDSSAFPSGPSASRLLRPPARDASLPAIAATVALVLFSVFIGVYGPRLGNRQQLPGGTTLVELAGAIEPRHAQRVFQAHALSDAPAFGPSEIEAELAAIVGRTIAAPSLADYELRWLAIDRVRLPGASGAIVFCAAERRGSTAGRRSFVSLLVLRDEDRFTVFDHHGRPVAMPEGEVFSVALRSTADDASLSAFRAGDLVFAVQSSDRDLSAEFVAALELAAARAEAGPEADALPIPDSGPNRAPTEGSEA